MSTDPQVNVAKQTSQERRRKKRGTVMPRTPILGGGGAGNEMSSQQLESGVFESDHVGKAIFTGTRRRVSFIGTLS
jgi:hypothetical protein